MFGQFNLKSLSPSIEENKINCKYCNSKTVDNIRPVVIKNRLTNKRQFVVQSHSYLHKIKYEICE